MASCFSFHFHISSCLMRGNLLQYEKITSIMSADTASLGAFSMYLDMFGHKRCKVGLHTHTTRSDGKFTPESAAAVYKAAGYDAIAITDHWKYHDRDEISGLKIISGCEYNHGSSNTIGDVMHIVGVGMQTDPCIDRATASRQDIINAIHDKGGLAILAHPAWSLNTPQDALVLSGFDGVEIYNTVSNVGQSSRPYSGYFVDLLANMGTAYPLIAADDTHCYEGVDDCKAWIMARCDDDSVDAILDSIRRGDYYATQGPEVHVRREGDKIIADCTPCATIDFLSNSAWVPDKMTRGKELTRAEYQIKAWEKWVRVEVCDDQGRFAWSSVIMITD